MCENSSLWTKQIFGLTERGVSPAGWAWLHRLSTISGEEFILNQLNLKKITQKNHFSLPQDLHPQQGQMKNPTCLFYGQSNKGCQLSSSWVSKVGDVTTLIQLCEVEWDPQPEDWRQIAALKWPTRAEQPDNIYELSNLELFNQRTDFPPRGVRRFSDHEGNTCCLQWVILTLK